MKKMLGCALVLISVAAPARASSPVPAVRPGAVHAVPLYGTVVHVYDAPDNPYAPGHRGVDVAASAGTEVRASANGVVSFAGLVAGNRSVTIDHGNGLKTTASYLATSTVVKGQSVVRGQVVGTVGAGHPLTTWGPHVHLSARLNDVYFDPLSLYVGSSHSDLLALTG